MCRYVGVGKTEARDQSLSGLSPRQKLILIGPYDAHLNVTPYRELNFGALTKIPPSLSITRFRCAGRVDRPKGNPVRFAIPVARQIRSCPRNCRRRALLQFATGPCTQGLGRRRRVKTREPGDLPEQSSFRRAGRALGAVFRCGDRGELSSGRGTTAMPLLLPIFASDETSRRGRTASVTARRWLTRNWNNRLCIRHSRFYSTQTGPNALAKPNLSFNHRASRSGGRAMSRMGIFLGAAMALALVMPTRWTAAFVAAAPAMAAEIAVKAPWQPPIVQAYDWTGLYVGAHLGYAWGRSNWSAPPNLSSSLDFDQSSDIFSGAGSYFGGLQIGYDYMLPNRVVLGAQLDTSFPGFPRHDISIGGVSIFSTPATGLARYSENVLHFGTLRGRVGYAPGNWLLYGTGGFAWTYDQLTLTQLADGTTDSPFLWRLGWAAGLGVEYALAPNWTVNFEYLFTKYGNSSVMFPSAGLQFTSDFSSQQARASLNYRFGGG